MQPPPIIATLTRRSSSSLGADGIGAVSDILFQETTTIGLRWRTENRIVARRQIRRIETRHGTVRVKLAESKGRVVNMTPEYDDCKRVALEKRLPLKQVMDDVKMAAANAIGGADG